MLQNRGHPAIPRMVGSVSRDIGSAVSAVLTTADSIKCVYSYNVKLSNYLTVGRDSFPILHDIGKTYLTRVHQDKKSTQNYFDMKRRQHFGCPNRHADDRTEGD